MHSFHDFHSSGLPNDLKSVKNVKEVKRLKQLLFLGQPHHRNGILSTHLQVSVPSKRDIVNPFTSECASQEQPENWNNEITELEKFFDKTPLPAQAIKLGNGTTITDCPMFIRNHLGTVRANNGRRIYLPYLQRLQTLKQVLTDNSFESRRTDFNDDEINKKKGIEWLIGRATVGFAK